MLFIISVYLSVHELFLLARHNNVRSIANKTNSGITYTSKTGLFIILFNIKLNIYIID